jgi:Tol biopolymer transport system component
MKKFQIILLFLFFVGCAPSQPSFPTEAPNTIPKASLAPTQTAIPPTETLTPSPTFTPPPAGTAISGGGGKIAFVSERDGYPEIYVINSDGSDLTKLANDITPKFSPAWSPDGRKIMFATNNDDSASLYIMNADGSNPTKFVDTRDIDIYDPADPDLRFVSDCCSLIWSADGKKVAFNIRHYVGCCLTYSSGYMIDADGNNLISVSEQPAEDFGPIWSPDSQRILLESALRGTYVMNADGTNPIRLPHGGSNVAWSPDGEKIAFHSGPYNNVEVYVMNADGTNPINLTNYGAGWDGNPIWSPDGEKIAFSSYRDGNWEIYVMNDDGTNAYNLTKHQATDNDPVWSPDSTKISFVSGRNGNSEIYVINVDGSNLVNLTENDANDSSPVWSP